MNKVQFFFSFVYCFLFCCAMHNMLCCKLQDQFAGPRDEFSNEVDLLAKIDHRNLVRLLGFTDKGNERIIITEYVPNGTLREHLDGKLCSPLCFLHFSVHFESLCFPFCFFFHLSAHFKSLVYDMYYSILQVSMAESWILISA